MNPKIKEVRARQILDSRGNPTVEVDVITDYGLVRAAVPSGASTGEHEAVELRDNKKEYFGKGVEDAVSNIHKKIAKRIIGISCLNQVEIDVIMMTMDATKNKSNLGANAILAVSMAVAKAGALAKNQPLYQYISELYKGSKKFTLPIPSFNVINGGVHAGNELNFQEYMVLPVGAKDFKQALKIGSEIYHHLKGIIKKKYGLNSINVGDEGGFAPPLNKIEEPLRLLNLAVKKAGYKSKVKFGIDVAASEFYKDGKYEVDGKKLTSKQLINVYLKLIKKYPIITIEDPFDENDFESFAELKKKTKIQIVGDDLLVTNVKRIEKALQHKSCNALLLKINQIGTITEALSAAKLAVKNNWNIMVSHRSGETSDDFIADLAVGISASQIKSGATCRGERLAKYNQLLRIQEHLGKKAKYSKFKVQK